MAKDKSRKKRSASEADVAPQPLPVKKKKSKKDKNPTDSDAHHPATPASTAPARPIVDASDAGERRNASVEQNDIPARQKPIKVHPTKTRITAEVKKELADSNCAIYAAVAKSVKKDRHTIHAGLQAWIATRCFTGLTVLMPSSDTYYALVFDTSEHRDKALAQLKKHGYKRDGHEVKCTFVKFGDPDNEVRTVWSITVGPFASLSSVRDALVANIRNTSPGVTATFVVRKKLENEIYEPPRTCRFCGNGGHTIFECTTAGCNKELGGEQMEGTTDDPHGSMEMAD